MADLENMAADLEAYFAEHQVAVNARLAAATTEAVDAVNRLSSPAYGVAVNAASNGSTITVDVRSGQGPVGTLFGGSGAIEAEARRTIDTVMTEAGLDRRG